MSKQSSSEKNQQLPSSMGQNPLLPPSSSSSSSTLNPSSVHSSTLHPPSIHGSFAPSSSATNPAASIMHESLFLPSSSSTLNPSPSTLGGLFSSSSTMNPRASSHRSLLPSSSTRLFIDPVGPMPPSIPPSMRMMRFPAPRQETLLFEELFQGCRQMPVHDGVGDLDDEEEDNVTLELMPGARVPKRPKIDLTLTLKPPTDESPDRSRSA